MVSQHEDEVHVDSGVRKGSLLNEGCDTVGGVHGVVAEVDPHDSSMLLEVALDQVEFYFERWRLLSNEEFAALVEKDLSINKGLSLAVADILGALFDQYVQFDGFLYSNTHSIYLQ